MIPHSSDGTTPTVDRPAPPDLSGAFGFPAVASLRGLLPSRVPGPGEAHDPTATEPEAGSPASSPRVPVTVPDQPLPGRPVVVTTRRRGGPPGADQRWGVVRRISAEHVELLILSALGAGPADGRELVARLRDDSGGRLRAPANTVYRTLHRLARSRLVERRCDTGRPAYALTDAGVGPPGRERANGVR